MKPTQASVLRQREIAAIHVAKKQLALEDDEYRSIMLTVTGRTSAADLDWQDRARLLDHFKKIGFKGKAAFGARPKVAPSREAQLGKIEALLADAGRPWAYADAIAKRVCKVDAIGFCTPEQLGKVIAALSYDAKRHSGKVAEQ